MSKIVLFSEIDFIQSRNDGKLLNYDTDNRDQSPFLTSSNLSTSSSNYDESDDALFDQSINNYEQKFDDWLKVSNFKVYIYFLICQKKSLFYMIKIINIKHTLNILSSPVLRQVKYCLKNKIVIF